MTTGVTFTAIGVKLLAAGVKRGHGGVRFVTTVAERGHCFYAAPVQPQKQTRDSSNTQCAGIPCFQRFSRYSVLTLCIK